MRKGATAAAVPMGMAAPPLPSRVTLTVLLSRGLEGSRSVTVVAGGEAALKPDCAAARGPTRGGEAPRSRAPAPPAPAPAAAAEAL